MEIVDRETWRRARLELLAEEKAYMRQGDELAKRRRELPVVEIEKAYQFETNDGQRSLGDLFEGQRQLVIYHFMLGPEWTEGCPGCSFWADNFDGIGPHLAARDTRFLSVSRAPMKSINAYKERMGWTFDWVSSLGSEFNVDFGVSFPPENRESLTYNYQPIDDDDEEGHGLSVFIRGDGDEIYHSYSTFARGVETFNGAYHLLDLTPLGRNEGDGGPMSWLRRRDDYS